MRVDHMITDLRDSAYRDRATGGCGALPGWPVSALAENSALACGGKQQTTVEPHNFGHVEESAALPAAHQTREPDDQLGEYCKEKHPQGDDPHERP